MKKILLTIFAFSTAVAVNAQCSELFISEYVEGTGNDKAIEIYNPTSAAINLSGYRIERFSNGDNASALGGVLNLSGTIAAYGVWVVTNGQTSGTPASPACSPALQAKANQLAGVYPDPTYMNGDDAVVLFKNTTMIDIFGKIGEDPGVAWTNFFPYTDAQGKWLTKDYTLVRKSSVQTGVTVNPTAFNVMAQYDTLAKDTWTGLGSHACACSVGIDEKVDNSVSVIIYPNPSTPGIINVATSEFMETIEVYNMVGQPVLTQKVNGGFKAIKVETGTLAKGIYFAKISFANNKTSVAKLTIR